MTTLRAFVPCTWRRSLRIAHNYTHPICWLDAPWPWPTSSQVLNQRPIPLPGENRSRRFRTMARLRSVPIASPTSSSPPTASIGCNGTHSGSSASAIGSVILLLAMAFGQVRCSPSPLLLRLAVEAHPSQVISRLWGQAPQHWRTRRELQVGLWPPNAYCGRPPLGRPRPAGGVRTTRPSACFSPCTGPVEPAVADSRFSILPSAAHRQNRPSSWAADG